MKKQRTTYLPNEAGIDADAMEEITQLFGDGLDYEFAMEASDEEEPEYTEEGEERVKEVQLKDIFEPSELKERLLTDADELIRITDEPERFQLYRPAQTPPLDIDVEKESKWISDRLLAREYKRPIERDLEESFRAAVTHVLGFFNTDSLEVPFIWQHRRDFLYHPEREVDESTGTVVLKALRILLDQDDLWKIWEDDGRYRAIQQRLASLKSVWEGLDLTDRVVEEAIDEITSIEDVQGICSQFFTLMQTFTTIFTLHTRSRFAINNCCRMEPTDMQRGTNEPQETRWPFGRKSGRGAYII